MEEQRLVWLRRPTWEWQCLPHWRQIQSVPCPAPWFCCFCDFLFASACWTRGSSNWEKPWCTTCLQAEHSDVRVFHLLRSIPKAFRSHLQISSYHSYGLPLGPFPCTHSPYRRSFGIRSSAILTTCPRQHRHRYFSNVYMQKNWWDGEKGVSSRFKALVGLNGNLEMLPQIVSHQWWNFSISLEIAPNQIFNIRR